MPIPSHRQIPSSAPSTYIVVLVEESSGRIVRRVTGVSARAAMKLTEIFDSGLELLGSAVGLVDAFKTIGRALEPLTRPPARKLPPRRGRR